jgi:hypothetical protein
VALSDRETRTRRDILHFFERFRGTGGSEILREIHRMIRFVSSC